MNLLARREHAFSELRKKLLRRFDGDELDVALEKLRDEGLQCDERFAQSFTRERMLRGYGPQRIEAELRQRGVSRELTQKALRDVPEDEGQSWQELAVEVLHRKFGDADCSDFDERARRARFLAYRGFRESDAFLNPADS